jgi:phage shock protein PspC (stress-responsive transcriptional regulator)
MNKTININLGGLFFHIDESAYQKLNKYLNSIRRSLSDDPQGRDEIIRDIESRISELLSERVVDERQVISISDIDEIVKIMGQPEDYNVDEEIFNEPTYSRKRKPSKKLFRDGDDKFLGGVAAGTGHYIGIEPIWARIIWLIIAFGTGVGFIAYILLWILLPEAKTTANKLEMEGETVNIDNIEKKIREEFSTVSDKVREGANEVSSKIKEGAHDISEKISSADYKKYKTKAKSGLQEFLDTIGNILTAILKVFTKFIGAIIIFFSAITIIALVIALFSWGSIEALGIDGGILDFSPNFLNTSLPYWIIVVFAFFAAAIPFVVLFMLGLKILSNNARSFGKVTGLTLLAVWIICILGLIFTGIDVSSKYRHSGIHTTNHDLEIVKSDTLNVSMISNEDYRDGKSFRGRNNLKVVHDNNGEKLYSANINVDIRKSNTDGAYIKIRKSAHGRNYEDANLNAQKIEYQFSLDQTNLRLNNYFLNELPNGFFDQEIDVIIYLPKGQTIYLDKSTKRFLYDVANTTNLYDRSMPQHHYIMTDSELKCLDCETDISFTNKDEEMNLKISDASVQLKIKSYDGDVEVKVDGSGVTIK